MEEESKPTQEKNLGGQPTKYKESFPEEMIEYAKSFKRSKITGRYKTEKPLSPPTIGGFAIKIGVSREVLYDWKDLYPEFKKAMEILMTVQEEHIVDINMRGIGNTTFSIFMLKNNHGWTDRTETTIKNKTLEDLVGESFKEEE